METELKQFDRLQFLRDTLAKLIEQGSKCGVVSPNDLGFACKYRMGGKKCAFGFHIPDELYQARMENMRAANVLMNFPEVQKHLEAQYGRMYLGESHQWAADALFVNSVQGELHDGNKDFTPDGLRRAADTLALAWSLNVDFVKEAENA